MILVRGPVAVSHPNPEGMSLNESGMSQFILMDPCPSSRLGAPEPKQYLLYLVSGPSYSWPACRAQS